MSTHMLAASIVYFMAAGLAAHESSNLQPVITALFIYSAILGGRALVLYLNGKDSNF